MKNTIIVSKFLGLLTILTLQSGCFKSGANREAEVANCSIHDKKEALCNAAIRKDGRRCKFDKLSGNCGAHTDIPPKACDKMLPDECRASLFCTYKDATGSCGDADPALVGKCEVIQSEQACRNDKDCRWNTTAVVCEDKK